MSENYLRQELYNRIKTDDTIFDFIQNGFADGIWYWDLENPENEWMNAKFWEIFGINPKTKKNKSYEWQDIINKDDLKKATENFMRHLEDPTYPYDQIVRYKHTSGSDVWVRCRGMAIRDENGKPIRMIGGHNDVTDLKELENKLLERNKQLEESYKHISDLNSKLKSIANTDSLTGIFNRYFMDELLMIESARANRSKEAFSILVIDINDFKSINDVYGHHIGDLVLIDSCNKLTGLLREEDVLSRWGGDEFVIFLSRTDEKTALKVIDRIKHHFDQGMFVHEEIKHRYSLAIGYSEYVLGEDIDYTLRRADKRMYDDKGKKMSDTQ